MPNRKDPCHELPLCRCPPDDEILGAGATIPKLIADGHRVAVMCNSAEARRNRSSDLSSDRLEAMSIVGVSKMFSADFPNIKMNPIPHFDLVQFIETAFSRL